MKAWYRLRKMTKKAKADEAKDIGHNWDGITELDNPPPRWWLNALYISGLVVLIYFVLYPSLPLIKDSTRGLLSWTQINEYQHALSEIEQRRAPYEKQFAQMSVNEVLADADMMNYISASSKVLYGDNCAACHGHGGQPMAGAAYPVLADDDWLFGGSVNDIMMSIAKGRKGYMPALTEPLTPQQVTLLTHFAIDSSNGIENEAGRSLFVEAGCALCHGNDAKGDKSAGSANLTDKIWRFSDNEAQVRRIILHGVNDGFDPQTRMANMPQWNEEMALMLESKQDMTMTANHAEQNSWQDDLSGDEIVRMSVSDVKKLAIYVHQLGGGE